MREGERQVAPEMSGIRRDHLARYEWAAARLPAGSRVLDFGCGVGYGARLLAEAGHQVIAVDIDPEAIAYAREPYGAAGIEYLAGDVAALDLANGIEAMVAFEVLEHIEDPRSALAFARKRGLRLLASVPNEDKLPFTGQLYHHRHYRPPELRALLAEAGYAASEWLGQAGTDSEVEPGRMGRTIVIDARPAAEGDLADGRIVPLRPGAPRPDDWLDGRPPPRHVTIVGMGPTSLRYLDMVNRLGGRRAYCDEVWVINALGDVLACDRIFHMDDLRIQEARAAARPDGNIGNWLRWMRAHPGPIYTSAAHPEYPGTVAFPIARVLNACVYEYFNSTAAWAIGLAIALPVEKISFFGIDFSYPDAHQAERGRACCEYWIGRAMERGIKIAVCGQSTLLDAAAPAAERFYGYDLFDIDVAEQPDGTLGVRLDPHGRMPAAGEIERRYDHNRHPAAALMGAAAE